MDGWLGLAVLAWISAISLPGPRVRGSRTDTNDYRRTE